MNRARKLCPKCRTPADTNAADCVCGHRYRTFFDPPMTDQTVYTNPPKRKRPPWGIILALMLLTFGVPLLLSAVRKQATPTEMAASPGESFRAHQSDLRGKDATTGEQYIRCPLCNGSGLAPHLNGGSVDSYIACPSCNGYGRVKANTLARLVIVPDNQPTDYESPDPIPIGGDDPQFAPLIRDARLRTMILWDPKTNRPVVVDPGSGLPMLPEARPAPAVPSSELPPGEYSGPMNNRAFRQRPPKPGLGGE